MRRAKHTIKRELPRKMKRCECGAPLFRDVTCLRCEPDLMALFVRVVQDPQDRITITAAERELLIRWGYLSAPAEVA